MIEDPAPGRRFDMLRLDDWLDLGRERAVQLDAEADAVADRGEFARAAELRRSARGIRDEVARQERAFVTRNR